MQNSMNSHPLIDTSMRLPLSSDESFLMIVATEEKGSSTNTVQASVKPTLL